MHITQSLSEASYLRLSNFFINLTLNQCTSQLMRPKNHVNSIQKQQNECKHELILTHIVQKHIVLDLKHQDRLMHQYLEFHKQNQT